MALPRGAEQYFFQLGRECVLLFFPYYFYVLALRDPTQMTFKILPLKYFDNDAFSVDDGTPWQSLRCAPAASSRRCLVASIVAIIGAAGINPSPPSTPLLQSHRYRPISCCLPSRGDKLQLQSPALSPCCCYLAPDISPLHKPRIPPWPPPWWHLAPERWKKTMPMTIRCSDANPECPTEKFSSINLGHLLSAPSQTCKPHAAADSATNTEARSKCSTEKFSWTACGHPLVASPQPLIPRAVLRAVERGCTCYSNLQSTSPIFLQNALLFPSDFYFLMHSCGGVCRSTNNRTSVIEDLLSVMTTQPSGKAPSFLLSATKASALRTRSSQRLKARHGKPKLVDSEVAAASLVGDLMTKDGSDGLGAEGGGVLAVGVDAIVNPPSDSTGFPSVDTANVTGGPTMPFESNASTDTSPSPKHLYMEVVDVAGIVAGTDAPAFPTPATGTKVENEAPNIKVNVPSPAVAKAPPQKSLQTPHPLQWPMSMKPLLPAP